jgi:hypothetical protein
MLGILQASWLIQSQHSRTSVYAKHDGAAKQVKRPKNFDNARLDLFTFLDNPISGCFFSGALHVTMAAFTLTISAAMPPFSGAWC